MFIASTAPQFSQAPEERHVSIDEGRTDRPSAIKKNAAPDGACWPLKGTLTINMALLTELSC